MTQLGSDLPENVRIAPPVELLALILARREEDATAVRTAARDLLARCGSLVRLGEISTAELLEAGVIEPFDALRMRAAMELGRRIGQAAKGPVRTIDGPDDVAELLAHLAHEKQEHFYAVLLDAKNGVLKAERVHIGTLTMSLVGPREVFRAAIREGASSLIVAHNHPSGDPEPSPEDLDVTRRLVEIGAMLDIPVLDHVVIGGRRAWVSLQRRGAI